MCSATVIIPSTGSNTLEKAIESVVNQSYSHTDCWVIVDGPEFADKVKSVVDRYKSVKCMQLIENTGADKFYGHRIYAAMGYLINTDFILYLDEDNWFESDHVEKMIKYLENTGNDWCHSLRKIVDKNGEYLTDDNCENLGRYPAWVGENVHLVDTSCYCIKKEVIVRLSGVWYGKWGNDRVFLHTIAEHFPKWGCTGFHTVNYRLDGNSGSVTADFFQQGNMTMKAKYPDGYPWHK